MHAGLERKTAVFIVRGRGRGKHRKPAFINGQLPRPSGVKKLLVYHFDRQGDLLVTLMPSRHVEIAQQLDMGL